MPLLVQRLWEDIFSAGTPSPPTPSLSSTSALTSHASVFHHDSFCSLSKNSGPRLCDWGSPFSQSLLPHSSAHISSAQTHEQVRCSGGGALERQSATSPTSAAHYRVADDPQKSRTSFILRCWYGFRGDDEGEECQDMKTRYAVYPSDQGIVFRSRIQNS